jgi:hypothetical protein
MKKNLFDKEAAEKMISRALFLQATSKGKWGQLDVTEMLLHCNQCNNQILHGDLAYKKTTLKQRLLKVLALYIVPNFPKNRKTEHKNDMKGKISAAQFETQKAAFIEIIRDLSNLQNFVTLTHPAFGNLNKNEWGIAAWKHNDHHLRQFGV